MQNICTIRKNAGTLHIFCHADKHFKTISAKAVIIKYGNFYHTESEKIKVKKQVNNLIPNYSDAGNLISIAVPELTILFIEQFPFKKAARCLIFNNPFPCL